MQEKNKFRGLWLTDFDGTIKPQTGAVAPADLAALRHLGQRGWFRVVATGRSLFSFITQWDTSFELDALIFASGAGVCFWDSMGPGPLAKSLAFTEAEARVVLRAALDLDFGFFAYLALPNNHHFYYRQPACPPYGFQHRVQTFRIQSRPWTEDFFSKNPAPILSQILVMVPSGQADRVEDHFQQLAPGMSIIRSSSPFPDQQLWLEIFPSGVSKGTAAATLACDLGLSANQAVALGNDYNDQDLLQWAEYSFITSDAPPEMQAGHRIIFPAGQGGLAQAAEIIDNLLSSGSQP